MDFEKICMLFTAQEPFYGILLSSMDRVPTTNVSTIGVGRSGNVFKLYYNPKWVEQFDINTVLQLLKHEVLHIAFHHFTIFGGVEMHDPPEIKALRNVALDLEVNGYLDRSQIQKEAGGSFVEDFGWARYLGGREYFRRLLQQAQQQQEQQQQGNPEQKPCNGGQGGDTNSQDSSANQPPQDPSSQQSPSSPSPSQNGSTATNVDPDDSQTPQPMSSSPSISKEFLDSLSSFDDHTNWPNDLSDIDTSQLEQVVDDMLVFAAEECEKGKGCIPGELQGKITELRNKKKPKPVADWKRYFRRYLGNEFSEFIRKSKKRESRRFPDAAGNRHRRKSHILVAIDTSGSVSMPEYREFMGQLTTLTATSNFHVVECDTRIAYEYDYVRHPNEDLHGGGGTSFEPPIEMFLKNRKKYDALVYFTDGECDIPSNTPKETLWVISSKGDQSDRRRYKVNGASVVFIPAKQN